MSRYRDALELVESKIKELRKNVPIQSFNKSKLAEVEINKFYYGGESVDRIMIVLRANGCEHYKKNGGCAMCSHFNGTMPNDIVTDQNYIEQWNSVVNGTCLDVENENFSLNNFPVVCVYNLGSLLNQNEISVDAVKYIFKSLDTFKGVKKVIIESRAEYVKDNILQEIRKNFSGVVEVGIGVESTNSKIRQLCHHKGLQKLELIKKAVNRLHKYDFKALAYVNFKPCFLTETESIDDAIQTSIDCYNMGFDAVSIEPTSLQEYSLTNHLKLLGYYRVPWLWSLQTIVKGIYDKVKTKDNVLDLRLGGYFDEEVLSGSQGEGFAGRNEIFPYETSGNCKFCTSEFINCIKEFNKTYDIRKLISVNNCEHCYKIWLDECKVKDSRPISKRIIDILG